MSGGCVVALAVSSMVICAFVDAPCWYTWGSPLDAMTLVGYGVIRNLILSQLYILLGCSSTSMFPVLDKYSCNSQNQSLIACHDTPAWSLLRSWACHNAKSDKQTRNSLYNFSPRWLSTKGIGNFRQQMMICTQSNRSGLVWPCLILTIFNNHRHIHSSISGEIWHCGPGLFGSDFAECLFI